VSRLSPGYVGCERSLHQCNVHSHHIYRVIHKSVKHFKNSQQINYSTDHGSSYADRERNSPSFFLYTFHRCSMCPPLVIRHTSMRQSMSFDTRVGISQSTRATVAVIRLRKSGDLRWVEAQRQCPSQTPPSRKSRTGLNPVTGVATALTGHLLSLCVLSTFVASFDWDTLAGLWSEPESRLVERCNHYCSSFKCDISQFSNMFHGLMNNPVEWY